MIIFNDPKTAPIVGFILAGIFFSIQLLLCFRAKKTIIKWIPACLIILLGILLLFICVGLEGNGSGVLDNVNILVIAILAIIFAPSLLGIIIAWIIYALKIKRRE